MTHGVRPHMARGVCDRKLAFTTYSAAVGKMTEVPGAIRVIRGSCCGMYHITSMTEAEYAQWVADELAAQGCTDAASRGMMDLSTEEFLKRWDADHEEQQAVGPGYDGEPRTRKSNAGEAQVFRKRDTRLAPTPAALARRLQARSGTGR